VKDSCRLAKKDCEHSPCSHFRPPSDWRLRKRQIKVVDVLHTLDPPILHIPNPLTTNHTAHVFILHYLERPVLPTPHSIIVLLPVLFVQGLYSSHVTLMHLLDSLFKLGVFTGQLWHCDRLPHSSCYRHPSQNWQTPDTIHKANACTQATAQLGQRPARHIVWKRCLTLSRLLAQTEQTSRGPVNCIGTQANKKSDCTLQATSHASI
jgi:hypothetical protein